MLKGIPHTGIDAVWREILPWVNAACLRVNGRYEAEDVLGWLKDRNWQLWLASEEGVLIACCCTEIIKYPRRTYARVTLAGGHAMATWAHHMKDIEKWARIQGCDGIELGGRPGWKKIFPDWEQTNIFLEKEL